MALYGKMKRRHSLVQISLLSLKSSTIFTAIKRFCIVILFSMTIKGLVFKRENSVIYCYRVVPIRHLFILKTQKKIFGNLRYFCQFHQNMLA